MDNATDFYFIVPRIVNTIIWFLPEFLVLVGTYILFRSTKTKAYYFWIYVAALLAKYLLQSMRLIFGYKILYTIGILEVWAMIGWELLLNCLPPIVLIILASKIRKSVRKLPEAGAI